ncbi:MAG: universal stress protein [Acidobacteria bacterium]|nr:universal stress protein [Acidobacteriota bacterium]
MSMTSVNPDVRVTLQNILFATDFSSSSEAALPYALSVARAYDSQVYVAHVIRPDLFQLVPAEDAAALQQSTRRHAEEQMAGLLISGRLRDVPHRVLIGEGPLWPVTLSFIEEHQVDLVVVGTHGRTGARKLLLGSAAEEIFRLAPCPVLTVGPHVTARPPEKARIRRLLLATDFSAQSERATTYGLSLAQEHQEHITLLHVVKDAGDLSERNHAVLKEFFTRRLQGIVPQSADLWCDPQIRVEFGDPAETILASALTEDADLLVLGIRRSGNFSGHLPPATAYKVVCQSRCPVLTVRG